MGLPHPLEEGPGGGAGSNVCALNLHSPVSDVNGRSQEENVCSVRDRSNSAPSTKVVSTLSKALGYGRSPMSVSGNRYHGYGHGSGNSEGSVLTDADSSKIGGICGALVDLPAAVPSGGAREYQLASSSCTGGKGSRTAQGEKVQYVADPPTAVIVGFDPSCSASVQFGAFPEAAKACVLKSFLSEGKFSYLSESEDEGVTCSETGVLNPSSCLPQEKTTEKLSSLNDHRSVVARNKCSLPLRQPVTTDSAAQGYGVRQEDFRNIPKIAGNKDVEQECCLCGAAHLKGIWTCTPVATTTSGRDSMAARRLRHTVTPTSLMDSRVSGEVASTSDFLLSKSQRVNLGNEFGQLKAASEGMVYLKDYTIAGVEQCSRCVSPGICPLPVTDGPSNAPVYSTRKSDSHMRSSSGDQKTQRSDGPLYSWSSETVSVDSTIDTSSSFRLRADCSHPTSHAFNPVSRQLSHGLTTVDCSTCCRATIPVRIPASLEDDHLRNRLQVTDYSCPCTDGPIFISQPGGSSEHVAIKSETQSLHPEHLHCKFLEKCSTDRDLLLQARSGRSPHAGHSQGLSLSPLGPRSASSASYLNLRCPSRRAWDSGTCQCSPESCQHSSLDAFDLQGNSNDEDVTDDPDSRAFEDLNETWTSANVRRPFSVGRHCGVEYKPFPGHVMPVRRSLVGSFEESLLSGRFLAGKPSQVGVVILHDQNVTHGCCGISKLLLVPLVVMHLRAGDSTVTQMCLTAKYVLICAENTWFPSVDECDWWKLVSSSQEASIFGYLCRW